DFGADTKPAFKTGNGLMQKHPEPVDGHQSVVPGVLQETGLQGNVDNVCYDAICGRGCEIQSEITFALHSDRCRVDDQAGPGWCVHPGIPFASFDRWSEIPR